MVLKYLLRSEEGTPQMHNTNGKLVRALTTTNLGQHSSQEFGRNIILIRSSKAPDSGQILLRTNEQLRCSKSNLVTEDSGSNQTKQRHILIQQNDITDGVLVQSVKRLSSGTPIFLLGGSEGTNGHILIQTGSSSSDETHLKETANADESSNSDNNILVRAFEGIHDNEVNKNANTSKGSSIPLGSDGEPIKLPENLESLPRADHFPTQRHRWNTNEEIAATLISFDRHAEWQSKEVKIRPKSGSMLLYSRKKVRYRRDGYCWKKRKDGKTTREDHMKLKVQGTECIYGCYVHSAILPTFHRRCYWLLQNPDIVLVHYLNVPYPDDNKLAVITPSLSLWADKKEWTKEELVSQLKPMFFSEEEPDLNNELEISTAETVEAIVSQLMEKQRVARQTALVKQLECGCPDSTCADGKSCSHPTRRQTHRPGPANSRPPSRQDNNQVSSTTGSGSIHTNGQPPRVYSREIRGHQIVQKSTHSTNSNTPPLVLSLSQIQGGGGLLILNNNSPQQHQNHQSVTHFAIANNHNQRQNKHEHVLKQEAMDTSSRRESKMEVNVGLQQAMLDFNRQHEVIMTSAPATPTKRLDNQRTNEYKRQDFENVVMLGYDNRPQVNKHNGILSNTINGNFNETLDLSQEDIQRTLSANMPLCSSNLDVQQRHREDKNESNSFQVQQPTIEHSVSTEINPMDFINTCDVAGSPTHAVDDDVFVNLDAFDMLGEFPDLEVLESTHNGILDINSSGAHRGQKQHIEQIHNSAESSAKITDYSPEWAYPEGGVKVLVTGPWQTNRTYSILFDTFPVHTTLVQSGVLRCYCPAHEAGLANLQVACEGYVISNSVIFEYKLHPREQRTSAPEMKVEKSTDNLLKFTLLQRLEAMDDRLQVKEEPADTYDVVEDTALFTQSNFEDRLLSFCRNMTSRTKRHNEEVCAGWFPSHRGMTLLHLAAALGYSRLLSALLNWRAENPSLLLETEMDALSRDDDGFTPLMWACSKGHLAAAVLLYKWNHVALNLKNNQSQTALECARSNNYAQLISEIEALESRREKTCTAENKLGNPFDNTSSSAISLNGSLTSLISVASSSKSHDGVFLRPGAVTRSETNKYKMLNLDIDSDSSTQDCNKMLGCSPSPLLSDYSSSTRSIGSFQKLVKRPSIDSGIHLTGNYERTKSYKCATPREISRISKYDRSMSLPLNSQNNIFDDSTDARGRKMDFVMCKLNHGPRSPLIDVEAVSDDEVSEIHTAAAVGDQNARVLTLAEQIIAAMPDRIKNESQCEEMILGNSPGHADKFSMESLQDTFMEPLFDQSRCNFETNEFNFEFSDNNYRYYDVSTPCSSLSPASSSCLQSPSSFILDPPSPPPTTADFCEFFQASGSVFEKDFSNLTLSDREQRELYEAAKVIQKAYRSYKGRQQREQEKEREAATVIQNYYRRYKQFAWCKQATQAATVIQHAFRSYCEKKRLKKSQQAAVCIQTYYRSYKEQEGRSVRGEPQITGFRRTISQRRQNQAARKIQQFMRQSKNKLQRERAEKEKLRS